MDSRDKAVLGLTIASPLVLIVTVVFNALSTIPTGNGNIFISNQVNLSAKYETDLTPDNYAFSIWSLIYVWQLAWIVYALTTICRRNFKGRVLLNPIVLPISFYVSWIFSCVFNISWLFMFDREYLVGAFIVILLYALTGYAAMGFQAMATENNKDEIRKYNSKLELNVIYIIIQNGLATLFSWITIATFLSLSIALAYHNGGSMSVQDASTLSLSFLLVVVIVWSILENTVFFKYAHAIYAWYGVLVWAGIAILVKNYDINNPNTPLTMTIIGVGLVCFVIKVIVHYNRRHTLKSHSFSNKVTDMSTAM